MSRKDRRKTLAVPYSPAVKSAIAPYRPPGSSASAAVRRLLRLRLKAGSIELQADAVPTGPVLNLQLERDLRHRIEALAKAHNVEPARIILALVLGR